MVEQSRSGGRIWNVTGEHWYAGSSEKVVRSGIPVGRPALSGHVISGSGSARKFAPVPTSAKSRSHAFTSALRVSSALSLES